MASGIEPRVLLCSSCTQSELGQKEQGEPMLRAGEEEHDCSSVLAAQEVGREDRDIPRVPEMDGKNWLRARGEKRKQLGLGSTPCPATQHSA